MWLFSAAFFSIFESWEFPNLLYETRQRFAMENSSHFEINRDPANV